jgi:hypothetical protein
MNIPIGCGPEMPNGECGTCLNFDGCKAWPKGKYLESKRAMDGLTKANYREIYYFALRMDGVPLNDRFAFDIKIKKRIRGLMAMIENKGLEVKK